MATKPLSNSVMQEAVDALTKAKGVQTVAAAALGLPINTFKSRVNAAERRGVKPTGGNYDPTTRIKQLEAELKAAQRESADAAAIKQIVGAIATRTSEIITPPWMNFPSNFDASPGAPTLFLSDLHWGEVVFPGQINNVNSYNLKLANQRMKDTYNTAVHLLRIIDRKLNYPGIVLALGGDMISGDIHEELAVSNEVPTMPTLLDLFSALIGVINQAANDFGNVFIPCVGGNHGRNTHKVWAKGRNHTSFDWLLYQFLSRHFAADKRITFFIPDGSDAFFKVYGTRYLLSHGDQFRGGDGMIGALGPIIRGDHKKRSRNSQIDMEYDVMMIGHWHQYMHLTRLIVNGSMKGYDEYAYTSNFGFERPQQALWLTHPKHGITFRMPVHCDRATKASKTEWVSVPSNK